MPAVAAKPAFHSPMACPACGMRMEQSLVGGLSVDVCKRGCGGVWFDRFELREVDEAHESAGDLLDTVTRNPEVTVDHGRQFKCPRCQGQPMLRHFWSAKRSVEVDECPRCAGMWLDAGELGAIRAMFATEAERMKAADAYFQDVFGGELAKMRAESAEQAAKAKKIAWMLRWLCPSWYVPGKQSGAAF